MDALTHSEHTSASLRRWARVVPAIELGVLALWIAIAAVTYWIVTVHGSAQQLLTPPVVALLLVANMVPSIALLVLIGRRIAMHRAAAAGLGTGQLHVRLVAIFSVLASVPMLLVTIFASLLFQYGVEFWTSDRAQSMLDNASAIARANYARELSDVGRETTTMRDDLLFYLESMPIDSERFVYGFGVQVFRRELSEGMIVEVGPDHEIRTVAIVNPHNRPLDQVVTPEMIREVESGKDAYIARTSDRIVALTYLDRNTNTYLYAARILDPLLGTQIQRVDAILADYQTLRDRSRTMQLRFNIALLLVSLFIVGLAVFVALEVADRVVRPVRELVFAAQKVAGGDLTARVATPRSNDELGVLASAFNRMTERLQDQTNALVRANEQIESRRALIEAVMSGVSAGVISIDAAHHIQLINDSALELLKPGNVSPVGRLLVDVAPELDALLQGTEREAIVQLTAGGEARTLAVNITSGAGGQVLTFDDITQQLLDQRRAAWSDVARRIAHEIKNPLTPIQLAAERLQRRYGNKLESDDGVFARLTETIVRQVGDLRRMVDEFSSFARMPKPMFRRESLSDIARQTLFLHEVAHPAIAFTLDAPDPSPTMVCDRRQIGQALTNVVKNAVEAVEARLGDSATTERGAITLTLCQDVETGTTSIQVDDNGIGLPPERDRIVEPYMTTRSRGTGLGLAIVTKIVEEHFGTITFNDRPGGGTRVLIVFDTATLDRLDEGEEGTAPPPTPTPASQNEEIR